MRDDGMHWLGNLAIVDAMVLDVSAIRMKAAELGNLLELAYNSSHHNYAFRCHTHHFRRHHNYHFRRHHKYDYRRHLTAYMISMTYAATRSMIRYRRHHTYD